MNTNTQKYIAFTHSIDAYIELEFLRSLGIECWIEDDGIISSNWFYSNAVGGVKVVYNICDHEEVKKHLVQRNNGQYCLENPTKCNLCQSTNVTYIEFHWITKLLFFVVVHLVPPIRRNMMKCISCGNEWKKEGSHQSLSKFVSYYMFLAVSVIICIYSYFLLSSSTVFHSSHSDIAVENLIANSDSEDFLGEYYCGVTVVDKCEFIRQEYILPIYQNKHNREKLNAMIFEGIQNHFNVENMSQDEAECSTLERKLVQSHNCHNHQVQIASSNYSVLSDQDSILIISLNYLLPIQLDKQRDSTHCRNGVCTGNYSFMIDLEQSTYNLIHENPQE